MLYTLDQARADDSLPLWWTEPGCPDYARSDEYRHIDCALLIYEIRRGMTEAQLRARISHRKYNAKARAKKVAAREAADAALTPEQRAAQALHKREGLRLNRLNSQVKMWRKRIADAEARGDILASLSLPSYRINMQQVEQQLAAYVDQSLAAAFKRLG
jgi:hypothetical protein